ncbi:MAG: T9SS type A sorting domain-containing protein [Phycisphaerales bacterium]|nr:T9SS type A sorting domain-containing protein [Phycisphaerales bacterium]
MFKKSLLLSLSLGVAYITLCSYPSRPATTAAGDCTGAMSTSSCGRSGCHALNTAASINSGVTLVDKVSGTTVTTGKYTPLKVYTVTLTGTNSGALPKFGFQICALGVTKTNIGTISNNPASTSIDAVSGRSILEQTAALPGVVSSGTATYTVTFDWTAPAAGQDSVTFYSIINAVNGDNRTTGDAVAAQVSNTFTENTTAINEQNTNLISKIYPNPANNVLTLEGLSGEYAVSISDLVGRVLISKQSQSSIDVSSLTPGIYNLRIVKGSEQQTAAFVKQ